MNPLQQIEALTLFLMRNIEGEEDPKVKALLWKGTAKMVLTGMITDVDVNTFQCSPADRYLTAWTGNQKSD